MNAHRTILPVDRYDRALDVLIPAAEAPEKRRLRRRLLTSRDIASKALARSGQHSPNQLALYQVALDIASTHSFRFCDDGTLKDAADACVRLFVTARALDRMEGAHGAH